MRNLATGLFLNYKDLIRETALEIHTCDNSGDIDLTKKIGLKKLAPLRRELNYYPTFRLEKKDMLEVAKATTDILADLDPLYCDGSVDTTQGNASIIVQTGVVLAAIVGNFKMIQSIRHHNQAIADAIERIHDIFLIDPGDERIWQYSEEFVQNDPIDAAMTAELLKTLTGIYVAEIQSICEEKNYLAKHIFSTGFNQYPGIGSQIDMLKITAK